MTVPKPPARQWLAADESLDLLDAKIRQGIPVYLIDDVLTLGQTSAFNLLCSRFVFQARGTLNVVHRDTMTLYQLGLRGQ